MYYAILTSSERRAAVLTAGAATDNAACRQAFEAIPAGWAWNEYTTEVRQAASRGPLLAELQATWSILN